MPSSSNPDDPRNSGQQSAQPQTSTIPIKFLIIKNERFTLDNFIKDPNFFLENLNIVDHKTSGAYLYSHFKDKVFLIIKERILNLENNLQIELFDAVNNKIANNNIEITINQGYLLFLKIKGEYKSHIDIRFRLENF